MVGERFHLYDAPGLKKVRPGEILFRNFGERVVEMTELAAIAARELAKHGLRDWTFRLSDTKRRLGACNWLRFPNTTRETVPTR